MRRTLFDLNKRFETSVSGPLMDDRELSSFLNWCITNQQFIAAVAVNPHQLVQTSEHLEGTGIRPAVEIAFPLGGLPTELKIKQIQEAIDMGAKQLDIVMKIEALRDGNFEQAMVDAVACVESARQQERTVALIPNLAYLEESQKMAAVDMVFKLQADIRTNTGFDLQLTTEEITMLHSRISEHSQIIACGGIATAEMAVEYINAGADRISSTHLPEILVGIDQLLKGGLNVSTK